jgi:UDP-3-O-[3-hydroxymyristoyl] glucosamine N-acyltransferase
MTLKDIADHLNGQLFGPPDLSITSPAKIEEASAGQITFIANPKYLKFLETTQASAIIVDKTVTDVRIPHIRVPNAYASFTILLKLFEDLNYSSFRGISDNAFVDSSATIAGNASIAPLAYIGPNVKIDENTVIFPGVVLLQNVNVGKNCRIYPNVSVRENCKIGDRVILHNGVVVGSDGFGFAPQDGKYIKIPQLGNVVIENDVEIGANTTIDRATLGSTIVKRGTKLDNLIQIAHNVVIGEDTVIAAQTGISGSAEIGNHVTIGGQVGIAGHLKITDEVMIAAQSGISKDVKEKTVLFGSPAVPIMQRKRIDVSLRHLPEMVKRMQVLEKEVAALRSELEKNENRSIDGQKTKDD